MCCEVWEMSKALLMGTVAWLSTSCLWSCSDGFDKCGLGEGGLGADGRAKWFEEESGSVRLS